MLKGIDLAVRSNSHPPVSVVDNTVTSRNETRDRRPPKWLADFYVE